MVGNEIKNAPLFPAVPPVGPPRQPWAGDRRLHSARTANAQRPPSPSLVRSLCSTLLAVLAIIIVILSSSVAFKHCCSIACDATLIYPYRQLHPSNVGTMLKSKSNNTRPQHRQGQGITLQAYGFLIRLAVLNEYGDPSHGRKGLLTDRARVSYKKDKWHAVR